jgi:glycosyltransferase involved in cell wall biosynthesis
VKLLIIGRMEGWYSPSYGDYRERLRARAAEADLSGRVEFLGQRSDVLDLYQGAGIHCAPSTGPEGLPNVVLEAKLLGRPTVAFNYNSFPELISHGVDGWLCAEQTAESLAGGLAYFLEDATRIAVAGQHARESLKRFSVETFRERWAAEFAV